MSQTQAATTHQLTQAFDLFNQMSTSLGESYQALQEKVVHLSSQLEDERSEKLRQLAAKEQLANRLTTILSALPGGVLVLNGAGLILETNLQALALFPNAAVGRCWHDVLVDQAATLEDIENQQSITLIDGRNIWVSRRILDDEANQVLLLADVSEVHRWQETVNRERRLAALGEMAARLAHQLRTPLSSAVLYLSHLEIPRMDAHRRSRLCECISGRLRHIEELIEGMLAFVRGSRRTESEFTLATLIDEARNTIDPALSEKGGSLTVNLERDVTVHGSFEDLLAVLITLGENAIERIADPQLVLTARSNDEWIDITMSDNGPGVAPEIADRIFDPFFTTRANGTGLGLAIASMIAKEHGGCIDVVQNGCPGATFKVRITQGNSLEKLSFGDGNTELMESVK